jgi:Fe2+ or Zn2+ uptake regulation protein
MRNILKEMGFKATPARLAILYVLSRSKTPLNAEDILGELKKNNKHKKINEATVYRTLSALEEGTLLKRIDRRRESAYFELAKKHHHHISCLGCDAIEDFENDKIEAALGRITRGSYKFSRITDHSLELFGLCKKCS